MFSIAIIIFREVLEISLILGVLLAATKGVPGRGVWVWLGLFLGIIGALVIAFFADRISQAAQGMGQEMMNAAILFTAAALIGWTVVWMNKHGREISMHFKEVGKAVVKGIKPKHTLSLVVALSVLREGSEIVMFVYSSIVTGVKPHLLVLGSILGIILGSIAGFSIYYGLMKIPLKKVMEITSVLLMLLVAGMVAQAFGYLAAGGFVPDLIPTVWDTSQFISEGSLLGRLMHVLVGYTDRPSGIQLLAYVLTIIVLWVSVKTIGQARELMVKKLMILAVLGLVLIFGFSARAYAEKRVFSPLVTKGEWEYETTGVYDLDHAKNKNAVQEYKNALGYGVTNNWATELEIEMERADDEEGLKPFKATHMEWENIIQLTPQGQYWLDAGVYLAYEAPLISKEVGRFEGKILLEKSYDKITHTLNISFNKEVGGGADVHTDGGVAWSSKYRLISYFEPGFEYYNDFSAITHQLTFDQQSHQIGPAFYGRLTRHIKYDIGYLFGLSHAAPQGELKWVLEYEF